MVATGKVDAVGGIAKVDLRGLKTGSQRWDEARAAVTASMEALGAVVVAHDAVSPALRQPLFCRAMPELFALPLDVKRGLIAGHINGYVGPRPGAPALESVRIWTADNAGAGSSRRNLADVLWPHGNPLFRDTIGSFAESMLELEQTMGTMILEGLGVRKEQIDACYLESVAYNLRLSHYGALAPDMEATRTMSMRPHCDPTMLAIIVQHEVEGLEVQNRDGSWLVVPPEPDTVTVVAGELLTVLTNGRVPACVHRVRTPSNRDRLSVLFVSEPKEGCTVRALDELVDENHPLQYDPCNFVEYIGFRYGQDGGRKFTNPLKAFCGVVKDELWD